MDGNSSDQYDDDDNNNNHHYFVGSSIKDLEVCKILEHIASIQLFFCRNCGILF